MFSLSLFANVLAAGETTTQQVESVQNTAQGIKDTTDTLTNENTRDTYLKQEWTKVLEKGTLGGLGTFLLFMSKLLTALSPLFLLIIGIEYTLSWIFFLSLGVWVVLVIVIYKPAKIFTQKQLVALAIGVIAAILISQGGTIPNLLTYYSVLFSGNLMIFIMIVAVIISLVLYSKLVVSLGKMLKSWAKQETEQTREDKAKTAEKIDDIKIKSA